MLFQRLNIMKKDEKNKKLLFFSFIFLGIVCFYFIEFEALDIQIKKTYTEVPPARTAKKLEKKLVKKRQGRLYNSFHANILSKKYVFKL